jgi:DNA-binding cell septation regulator SpoVG
MYENAQREAANRAFRKSLTMVKTIRNVTIEDAIVIDIISLIKGGRGPFVVVPFPCVCLGFG